MSEYTDLVARLRERARIRRKMRLEGKRSPERDRVADDLDAACNAIEALEKVFDDLAENDE